MFPTVNGSVGIIQGDVPDVCYSLKTCCSLFLQELASGRTSVFVAHRLSTVQRCDKIIVLSNGVVAEQGTHEELMAARRIYYDMWEVQKAADAEAEKVLESLSSFSSYDDPDSNGNRTQTGNGKHAGRELQTSQL